MRPAKGTSRDRWVVDVFWIGARQAVEASPAEGVGIQIGRSRRSHGRVEHGNKRGARRIHENLLLLLCHKLVQGGVLLLEGSELVPELGQLLLPLGFIRLAFAPILGQFEVEDPRIIFGLLALGEFDRPFHPGGLRLDLPPAGDQCIDLLRAIDRHDGVEIVPKESDKRPFNILDALLAIHHLCLKRLLPFLHHAAASSPHLAIGQVILCHMQIFGHRG
mmetsp:Transcript_11876/g.33452  ORF Transcript_11876/g.33452 Transcript_11876/m.33452 type:complete len:219 (+) Transcript_11876:1245-1901(+)